MQTLNLTITLLDISKFDGRALQRRQSYYMKLLTLYGQHRTFFFWFSVLDNAQMRNAVAIARKSIRVEPGYVNGVVSSHAS